MGTDAPQPYHEKRPWGEEIWFIQNTPATVKIITVLPGEALSLQRHKSRDEFWHVISGNGSATIGTSSIPLLPGDNHFIPRETAHRLTGGTELLSVLEISLGKFDERDIFRLEDRYGRAMT